MESEEKTRGKRGTRDRVVLEVKKDVDEEPVARKRRRMNLDSESNSD